MWDNVQLAFAPGNRQIAIFILAVLAVLLWAFFMGLWNGRMWSVASWFRHDKPNRYWAGQMGCGFVLLLWAGFILLLLNLPSCM